MGDPTDGASSLLLGFSIWQLLLVVWSLVALAVVLFVVYVVFFLDNIKGRNNGLPTDKVLRALQSELLPVTPSNGWRLSSFAHGVPLWRRTWAKESINDRAPTPSTSSDSPDDVVNVDLSLCASYTLCQASPLAVWAALKSLSENLEWNPHLQYLQRYPLPNGEAHADLPHPAIGRDHVLEGSSTPSSRSLSLFNRISSRLLGEVVFKQLAVLERWWWRPDDDDGDVDEETHGAMSPPAWLLTNDTQRLTWTFYCVEPLPPESTASSSFFSSSSSAPSSMAKRAPSARSCLSWVTTVTCCDRRLAQITEEVAATRLASLSSYVALSTAATAAIHPLLSGPRGSLTKSDAGVVLYGASKGRGALDGGPKTRGVDDLRGRSATLPAHLTRRSAPCSSPTSTRRPADSASIHHRIKRSESNNKGEDAKFSERAESRASDVNHPLRTKGESKARDSLPPRLASRPLSAPTGSLPSRVVTYDGGKEPAVGSPANISNHIAASAMDSSLSVSDEGVGVGIPLSGVDAVDEEEDAEDTSEDVAKDGSVGASSNSKSSVDPIDSRELDEGESSEQQQQLSTDQTTTTTTAESKSPLEKPPSSPVDEVAYHVIANQAAADLSAEVIRVSVIDLSTSESRQRADTGGWCFSGIEKDVVILRKFHAGDENLVSFLGKGIIPVDPEIVCNTLKNPHSRFMYDEQLKKLKVLHEFSSSPSSLSGSSDLKVLHMFHEVTHMLRRYSRDTCAIQGYRRDGANHLVTLRSVIWPTCPDDERQPTEKGVDRPTRITLLPSGWVVEPIARVVDAHSDSNGIVEETIGVASMVSYLIQVDLGATTEGEKMIDGWIDLVKKQPLGIAHLRQYLVPSHVSDGE